MPSGQNHSLSTKPTPVQPPQLLSGCLGSWGPEILISVDIPTLQNLTLGIFLLKENKKHDFKQYLRIRIGEVSS